MNPKRVRGKIDWMITLVPLAIVVALCILFFLVPEQSNAVLSQIRFFFGDTFGTYYLVIGLGISSCHCTLRVRSMGILFWVNPTKSLSIPSLHGAP